MGLSKPPFYPPRFRYQHILVGDYDCFPLQAKLGGGFKYFLFSSLFGEDSHFD